MIKGFLNINKPDGITSFGVVAKLRKRFGIKKIGHMGTLDPAGCGVLPLAIGKATKLFSLMQEKRKVYRAIFVFGKETNTLDSDGQVVSETAKIITQEKIINALPKFMGLIKQTPPNFSAKKVNGKRAYELARNDEEVILTPKNIEIFRFELLEELAENKFLFEIECSSGTYVRSLCRDLARELETVAYMPLIIRMACDDFKIQNSIPLSQILDSNEPIDKFLIPIENIFILDKIILNENEYKKIRNGLEVKVSNKTNGLKYLVFKDEIFSIGKVANDKLKMEIYLDD